MISYLLAANCYGFLFYGIYQVMLKGRSSHTWNRCYLLTITLLSLLLPLVKFEVPGWYTASVAHTLQAVTLPEVTLTANNDRPDGQGYTGLSFIPLLYIGIAGLLLLRMLYRIISLRSFLRRQQFVQQEGYRLAMNTGIGPASFGAVILFPGKEADLNILNHEKAHLYYGHHYDKLVMELVQCIFFAVVPSYFIRKELALVHEFEADAIAGTDKESYAYTLLSEHLGVRQFYFLQSFFHHPLKRRIRMLQRNRPGQRHRVAKTLVLLCSILFTCAIVYAQSIPLTQLEKQLPAEWSSLKVAKEPVATPPPVNDVVEEQETPAATPKAKDDAFVRTQDISAPRPPELPAEQPQPDQEISQEEPAPAVTDRVFTAVEQMPRPPMDNLSQYFAEHIRYPEEARKGQIQGRVVIQFVIDKQGNVVNPVLQRDIGGGCGAEAMRVVRNMPKWNPGTQGGQPVNVYYTLPVSFRMESGTSDNNPNQ